MKLDIHDMLDEYGDPEVKIREKAVVSAEKIKEVTMKKITQTTSQRPAGRMSRKILIAVAIVAALAATAFAVRYLLTPKDVAMHLEDTALADAFTSEDATAFDLAPQHSGDYVYSPLGIVSGSGLSQYADSEADRSYIVVAVSREDGKPITEAGGTGMTMTPLISGFAPWRINAWTLSGGYSSFIEDGVEYYLFDCTNIEVFADHTIYLAVYSGTDTPNSEILSMGDDGAIQFCTDYTDAHALFTLPIDKDRANPEAALAYLASQDMDADGNFIQ